MIKTAFNTEIPIPFPGFMLVQLCGMKPRMKWWRWSNLCFEWTKTNLLAESLRNGWEKWTPTITSLKVRTVPDCLISYDHLYCLSAHIFFDDAFEVSDENDDWTQVNQFVRTFMVIDSSFRQFRICYFTFNFRNVSQRPVPTYIKLKYIWSRIRGFPLHTEVV